MIDATEQQQIDATSKKTFRVKNILDCVTVSLQEMLTHLTPARPGSMERGDSQLTETVSRAPNYTESTL